MVHSLVVLPDYMMVKACLDHDTIEGTACLLGVSWPLVAADLKRRGLGTHAQIRRAHGLETRRPVAIKTIPEAFARAVAEGRITRGGINLGTDLRAPLPGVK